MRFRGYWVLVLFSCFFPLTGIAGNLDSPGTSPSAGSGMYTLQGLYDYLQSGATPTLPDSFQEPTAAPGNMGKSTNDIYGVIKDQFDASDATPEHVLDTATFFSTDPDNWGPRTGAIPTRTPVDIASSQPAGYYGAFDLSTVDTDLAAKNIRNGINLFGVAGTVIPSTGNAPATDVLFGRTFSNAGASGLVGTMANNREVNFMPVTEAQPIPAGYHNGSGTVAGDADLIADNIRRDVTIFEVTGNLIQALGAATDGDVLEGVTYSNTEGLSTGTMPNNGAEEFTPTTENQTIPAGYHDGAGLVLGDPNLVPENIRSGMDIFGVAGDSNVVDTSSGNATPSDITLGKTAWVGGLEISGTSYPAPVEQTGQTQCWNAIGNSTTCAGTGQDGELHAGVVWSAPRFTDNGDGTVTDNLTGLIWLKNANCALSMRDWSTALTDVASLNATGMMNGNDCEDSSNGGDHQSDWRLPHIKELQSLIDFGQIPALPWGHPFSNEQASYWSSTTYPIEKFKAYQENISSGFTEVENKTHPLHNVWPVRSAQ